MKNDDEKYNGWTNRPTWLTALWIDNEFNSHCHWRRSAMEVWRESRTSKHVTDWNWNRTDAARVMLADRLRVELSAAAPTEESNLFSDLLLFALSEVNWCEIADYLYADILEEREDELLEDFAAAREEES